VTPLAVELVTLRHLLNKPAPNSQPPQTNHLHNKLAPAPDIIHQLTESQQVNGQKSAGEQPEVELVTLRHLLNKTSP
jgi:hypothetical protein